MDIQRSARSMSLVMQNHDPMVLPERIELSSFNLKPLLDKALREPIWQRVYHRCVPVSSPGLITETGPRHAATFVSDLTRR
jgi:hypothetical protein